MPSEKRVGIWEDAGFLEVCHPKVAGLYRYWDSKRDGRTMPSRRDIDPVELKEWLSSIILYDVLRDPVIDFRYRVVGTRIAVAMGRDLTGTCVREHAASEDQAYALVALTELIGRRTYRFRNDPIRGDRGTFLSRDRIYLPLSENGADVSMLLLYFAELEILGTTS
jgi:hypothetical protein